MDAARPIFAFAPEPPRPRRRWWRLAVLPAALAAVWCLTGDEEVAVPPPADITLAAPGTPAPPPAVEPAAPSDILPAAFESPALPAPSLPAPVRPAVWLTGGIEAAAE